MSWYFIDAKDISPGCALARIIRWICRQQTGNKVWSWSSQSLTDGRTDGRPRSQQNRSPARGVSTTPSTPLILPARALPSGRWSAERADSARQPSYQSGRHPGEREREREREMANWLV